MRHPVDDAERRRKYAPIAADRAYHNGMVEKNSFPVRRIGGVLS
jgi:hypothetical protein